MSAESLTAMQPLSHSHLDQKLINHHHGSLAELAEFVLAHPGLFVITGAGISHASGIPTYRDEIGTWKSNTPIQHADFMRSEATRKRYWARSFKGWPNVRKALPNAAHRSLVALEGKGYVSTLVTQNIDRLHQKAGHRKVIDLHGRLDEVLCMDCGALTEREAIQELLWQLNPHFEALEQELSVLAPDGDAEVQQQLIDQVVVPHCLRCQGILKPNVVFYGSSVHKQTVQHLQERLAESAALLVIGSSLMVYSSFRFCKFAQQQGIPIICINKGLTRADALYTLKHNAECGVALSELAATLPALAPV
jgi:NAD-dependent SIR2 family protein deacetylase